VRPNPPLGGLGVVGPPRGPSRAGHERLAYLSSSSNSPDVGRWCLPVYSRQSAGPHNACQQRSGKSSEFILSTPRPPTPPLSCFSSPLTSSLSVPVRALSQRLPLAVLCPARQANPWVAPRLPPHWWQGTSRSWRHSLRSHRILFLPSRFRPGK